MPALFILYNGTPKDGICSEAKRNTAVANIRIAKLYMTEDMRRKKAGRPPLPDKHCRSHRLKTAQAAIRWFDTNR